MVMDGLSIGLPTLTGGAEAVTGLNLGAVQEVAVDLAAVSADTGQGGVRVNIIPKEGGNAFRGNLFAQLQTGSMQGSNYTDALKAAGLASAAGTQEDLGFQSRIRRADRPRSPVVLRHHALERQGERTCRACSAT